MATDQVLTAPALSLNGNAPSEQPKAGLPAIVYNGRQLSDLLMETLAAVLTANARAKKRPLLYVRGGALTRIVEDEDARPSIALVDDGALTGILAGVARWETVKPAKVESDPPVHTSGFPPAALVKAFLGDTCAARLRGSRGSRSRWGARLSLFVALNRLT